MSSYYIVYKWWTHQVYKRYPDGRKIKLGDFCTRKQANDFIEKEKEREQ